MVTISFFLLLNAPGEKNEALEELKDYIIQFMLLFMKRKMNYL